MYIQLEDEEIMLGTTFDQVVKAESEDAHGCKARVEDEERRARSQLLADALSTHNFNLSVVPLDGYERSPTITLRTKPVHPAPQYF